MKQSITYVAIAYLLISLTAFVTPAEKNLARATKTNNKLIFLYSEPSTEYEVAFTFKNSIERINCKKTQEIINQTITNANIEAANQSRFYDAIIIGTSDRDMAITFKDRSKDNAIARVKKIEGKLVFVECEPMQDYEIVDKYKPSSLGTFGLSMLTKDCPTHDKRIETLIKKSEKAEKPFDGIIYGSGSNDLTIRFK